MNEYINSGQIMDSDRLLTRIIIAIQAEKKVDKVPVDKLWEVIDKSRSVVGENFFPPSYDALYSRLQKMDSLGYIYLRDEPSPQVSTDLRGLLVHGPIQFDKGLAEGLEKSISETFLSVKEKDNDKHEEDHCPACEGKCIRDQLMDSGYYPC